MVEIKNKLIIYMTIASVLKDYKFLVCLIVLLLIVVTFSVVNHKIKSLEYYIFHTGLIHMHSTREDPMWILLLVARLNIPCVCNPFLKLSRKRRVSYSFRNQFSDVTENEKLRNSKSLPLHKSNENYGKNYWNKPFQNSRLKLKFCSNPDSVW